jgi:hypothetical protein
MTVASFLVWIVSWFAASQPPVSPAGSLDFEVFRTQVQPIFLAARGEHARCITCHSPGAGQLRLQHLAAGQTMWTEEESRKNFESVAKFVAVGDPTASRLLMHPLAASAGGDPFHTGGKHWSSQNDPEWQVLAAWVRGGAARPATTIAATAVPSPFSFEIYKSTVEPVFLKPRAPTEGSGNACFECHTRMATRMRLQPLAAGATAWTDQQSRQNFEVVSRLATPGDPMKSPLLRHPLAQDAGGDATHTGGKFWASQDDSEWQAIAGWVRAGKVASTATAASPPALDFDFYKVRVQPIFTATRGEHARCVTCHGPPLGLVRLAPGVTSWTDEESRRNFDALKRLVSPGDPLASRLLMHPLAASAGGDPFHTGGKHWTSQSDPEWQVLAAWVKGQTLSSAAR